MKKKLIWGCAAAIAAGTLIYWLSLRKGDFLSPSPEQPARSQHAEATVTDAADTPEPLPEASANASSRRQTGFESAGLVVEVKSECAEASEFEFYLFRDEAQWVDSRYGAEAQWSSLPAGQYHIRVTAPGWRDAEERFHLAEGERRQIAMLPEARWCLRGRVVNAEDGSGIRNFQVMLEYREIAADGTSIEGIDSIHSRSITTSDGRYCLAGFQPLWRNDNGGTQDVRLHVLSEGFEEGTSPWLQLLDGLDASEVDVALNPSRVVLSRIVGQVVSDNGLHPVEGAEVLLVDAKNSMDATPPVLRVNGSLLATNELLGRLADAALERPTRCKTTTDAQGVFVLDTDVAGQVRILAYHPALRPSFSPSFALQPGIPASPLLLELEEGVQIDGEVVLAESLSEHVSAERVQIRGSETESLVDLDEGGSFVVQGLAPGNYSMTVLAATKNTPAIATQFAIDRRDIVLDQSDRVVAKVGFGLEGRYLYGEVERPYGSTWSTWLVSAFGNSGNEGFIQCRPIGADGHFELTDLPSELIHLVVCGRDDTRSRLALAVKDVDLSDESMGVIRIDVSAPIVCVRSSTGRLAVDRLRLDSLEDDAVYRAFVADIGDLRLDSQGSLTVYGLRPGRYALRAANRVVKTFDVPEEAYDTVEVILN